MWLGSQDRETTYTDSGAAAAPQARSTGGGPCRAAWKPQASTSFRCFRKTGQSKRGREEGGSGRMLGKREADPAWAGLSRFGPVAALLATETTPAAGQALLSGTDRQSPRSGAPRHRRQSRKGPARPRCSRELKPPPAGIRSWLPAAPRGAPSPRWGRRPRCRVSGAGGGCAAGGGERRGKGSQGRT